MANRQQCIALISRIEGQDWNAYKCLGIDKTEAKLVLELLNKWNYYKKINCDRYYAKKEKINQSRKKKYQASKVEVFRK